MTAIGMHTDRLLEEDSLIEMDHMAGTARLGTTKMELQAERMDHHMLHIKQMDEKDHHQNGMIREVEMDLHGQTLEAEAHHLGATQAVEADETVRLGTTRTAHQTDETVHHHGMIQAVEAEADETVHLGITRTAHQTGETAHHHGTIQEDEMVHHGMIQAVEAETDEMVHRFMILAGIIQRRTPQHVH